MTEQPETKQEQFIAEIESKPETLGSLPASYQATYSRGVGLDVLADQLATLGVFDVLQDEGDMHRHNFGIGILNTMGVIERDEDGRITNMWQIVQALTNLAKGG